MHTCFMCRCRAFHECVCAFFSLGMGDPSQKTRKPQYLAEREENIRKRLARGTSNTFTKFQGLSLNIGVDIGL